MYRTAIHSFMIYDKLWLHPWYDLIDFRTLNMVFANETDQVAQTFRFLTVCIWATLLIN